MKQKTTDAAAEIRGLLWQDGDPDKIADCALRGGLTPEAVAVIEAEVAAGKAAIDALAKFDLAALRAENEATATAAAKTAKTLEKAESAHEEAAAAATAAAAALSAARNAFESVASRVSGGELPAEKLPGLVASIIAARAHYAEFEHAAARASALERECGKLEVRAEALLAEARRIKVADPDLVNARMAPLHQDYAASAKTLAGKTTEMKEAAATLRKQADAARAAYEAEKAKLPW
jgi:hypothetical protein